MMKTLLLASAASLSLVACVQKDAPSELARAIPTQEQVSIKLPDNASRSLNELAGYYVSTRNVTREFNNSTGWVLVLLHTIVQFPVTSISGDTYTWGPWSDALDPAEYKLDVRDVGDGTYSYQLSGRSKTEPGATFEVVIDGTADPRLGDDNGNGHFLLDFDAGRRVNPVDSGDAQGTVDVHYDLHTKHLDLVITSLDDHGQPIAADYSYNRADDGGGDMTFTVSGDQGGDPTIAELATLRSRWLGTGAGRGDARIEGGDLGSDQITASECWGTSFARVYYIDSGNFSPTEGNVADCAFATADLP